MQAAGSGGKDCLRQGPAMTSRSCDRDIITGTALIPALGPEAAACNVERSPERPEERERRRMVSIAGLQRAFGRDTVGSNTLKRHKKEVIMVESDQSLKSLCKLKDSVLEYEVTFIKEEPVSCGGSHLGETNIFVPPRNTQQYPLTHMKEEPYSYEENNVICSPKCTSTGPIQHYTSTYIKKEPVFCDEQVINKVRYQSKDHIQRLPSCIDEERGSTDRGNITCTNTCIHSCHTPLRSSTHQNSDFFKGGPMTCPESNIFEDDNQQYPLTHIKEEPEPSDGGNITNTYSIIDCTPYLSANIKKEPQSHEDEHLAVTNTFKHTDPTHHSSLSIKKEPHSYDQGNLSDLTICTMLDHTVHYLSTDVKEEQLSCDITIKHSEICTRLGNTQNCPSTHLKEEFVFHSGRQLMDMKSHPPTDHIQEKSSSF
ncbi:unnamed protein product [Ranitomeya imitator]|uniref:Uncharacterized protein n=1 Tax=Ranitomeya imitator TaxID=111125 RepID=A0ABN9KSX6_9NEOB|nr:unnamed protein product [Ranitomeya imitator]